MKDGSRHTQPGISSRPANRHSRPLNPPSVGEVHDLIDSGEAAERHDPEDWRLIEPVAPDVGVALANLEPNIENVVLPRLGSALEGRQIPFVLVLDDFERIKSARALDVVTALAAHVPPGSQLVLAARTDQLRL